MKAKGLLGLFVTLIMALTFMFSSIVDSVAPPDGQILGLQIRSTFWGIKQAALDAPGTFRMTNPQQTLYIVGWNIKDAVAFVGFDVTKQKCVADLERLVGGNVVNVKTMKELVEVLKAYGWYSIGAAQLPKFVLAMVADTATYAAMITRSFTTFLVVPVGVFDQNEYIYWEPREG